MAATVGALVAAAFVLPLCGQWGFPISGQDEGQLLVYPLQLLQGGVPNGTFQSLYGPTNLWVLAAAFKVFGPGVGVERAVGLLYRAAITASSTTLVWRRRGALPALAAGVISTLFFQTLFGEAAVAYVAALAFSTLALLLADVALAPTAPRRGLLVAAGGGFGLALGCRIDFLLPLLLAGAAIVWCERRALVPLLAGVLAGSIPVIVDLVQAGPVAVVRGEILQPIFVSGPSRRIPWDALAGRDQLLVVLLAAAALASLAAGAHVARRVGRGWTAGLLLATGGLQLGLLPEALQRLDEAHIGFVACFTLPAAMLLLPERGGWPVAGARAGDAARRSGMVRVAAGAAVLAACVACALPTYGRLYRADVRALAGGDDADAAVVVNDGRSAPVPAPEAGALESLLRAVDAAARPGDRVFVGPQDLRTADYDDTFIYFLLPALRPGSFYLEMDPGVANAAGSGLAAQIGGDRFVILCGEYGDITDPDPATRLGPESPQTVVHDEFVEVGAWGPWTLLERRP